MMESQPDIYTKGVNSNGYKKQFNAIANEYDKNRKKFLPCFDDFYISATNFIASNISQPKRVLDLGAGTGLLSYFWSQHYPATEFVLVDIADEMLDVARKRFADKNNVSYQVLNYEKEFPSGNFDVVISALSIHHLGNQDKLNLFERIYDLLPSGGVVVNYDQFCAGEPEMNDWFDLYWENQLENSGLTDRDITLWKERRKLDRECSIEQEIEMLNQCKFKIIKNIYIYHKFSVLLAIK